jgi:hypothetical protein
MVLFTPELKHHILTQYQANTRGCGFAALAHRYSVKGGDATLRYWYRRWDGTPVSLQRKPVSGRPRALTRTEVARYIRIPIRRSNRAHVAVHYNQLQESVQAATAKTVSIRSIRRYGRQELRARVKRTKKRTSQECKYINIIASIACSALS